MKGVISMMVSYMKRVKQYQVLNTLAFIITIFVNGLANSIPLNGKTTGEISDIYANLFAPAGITFAIWGLIYLGLAFFIIYQFGFLSKGKKYYLDTVSRIGNSFIIGCLANALWIFAWHYDYILISVLLMLVLLLSLIDIYQKVYQTKQNTILEKIASQWIFSVYLSWICVATIANITAFLVSIRWNGLGIPPQTWTMVVIIIATALTLRFVFYKKDVPYALVTQWAFIGIIMKHITVWASAYKGVIIMTAFCMVLIFASILAMPKGFQTQRS